MGKPAGVEDSNGTAVDTSYQLAINPSYHERMSQQGWQTATEL